MAKVTTISELLQEADNVVILCVKGRLKSVFKQKQRTKSQDQSKFFIQDVILEDGGVEIKATLWEREEIPTAWKGRWVYLLSTQNAKKQWFGVKTHDHEYQGKVTRELSVNDSAEIVQAGDYERAGPPPPDAGEAPPATRQANPPAAGAPPPQTAPQRSAGAAPTAQKPDKTIARTKRFVGSNESLVKIALSRFAKIKREYEEEEKSVLPPELFNPVFNSLVYGATNGGFAQDLPPCIEYKTLSPIVKAGAEPKAEPPPPPPKPRCKACDGILEDDGSCKNCPPADDDVPF